MRTSALAVVSGIIEKSGPLVGVDEDAIASTMSHNGAVNPSIP